MDMEIKIEYTAGTPHGVRPRAEVVLAQYDQARFYHLRHRLRPPVAAYGVSLAQVWPAFSEVLNRVEDVERERPFARRDEKWDDMLLLQTERLLYVLFEHLEDCDKILRSCFSSESDVGKNAHVKEYRRALRPYRDALGSVVNSMKHEQGRLRSIVFYSDTYVTPGFFVEGVKQDGSVGPDSRIHRGGDTAFSYAYHLRLHFVTVVVVSSLLSRAVAAILGPPDIQTEAASPFSNLTFRNLAVRLANMSRILFPDEYRQPFPSIQLRNALGETVLRVSFPSDTEHPKQPDEEYCGVSFSYRGDGVTNTFTVPYKLVSSAGG